VLQIAHVGFASVTARDVTAIIEKRNVTSRVCAESFEIRKWYVQKYYIIAVQTLYMGAGRVEDRGKPLDFDIWYFAINVLAQNVFLLLSELVKWKFTTLGPLLEKIILAITWKFSFIAPHGKILSTLMQLCLQKAV